MISTSVEHHPYPEAYSMRQTLCDELKQMEYLGIIRKSNPSYASPLVVVKEKGGSNRICIDYSRLKKLTVSDPHPMISSADVLQDMGSDR
ncbi:retrovirus-related pol polyprotein from transposon gypsy [Plakobranchus ocellatus]|uniref:Retrovirus-related pol polyprotein from transposon gypsy n=1 Tax=Plakobranchus ocellatus TaxID=259542 RepID=A0AAV3YGS1_9GAST|nr:retrovirus-related pol polyprotein from transposon gypsy [Plakobranchus ocellatus]